MNNQDLPRLRALVDWDGDGFINRGGRVGDLLNLANRPLTLHDIALKSGAWTVNSGIGRREYRLPVFYDLTDRGLFASEFSFTGTGGSASYLGANAGAGGEYTALTANGLPAGTYTVQFYIKGVSGFAGKTYQIKIQDNGPANPTPADYATYFSTNTTTITPTGDYVLVSHTFTRTATGSAGSAQAILRIAQVSGAASASVLRITGVSVHPGTLTTALPYNVGTAISLRDDIEPYIVSANWQIGMATPMDNVAAEGTATIQVRNIGYEFSMENPASFLYEAAAPANGYPYKFPTAKFKEGVLIVIEVQDATSLEWVEMWRGFLSNIDVATGVPGATATLSATQGLFKFGANRVDTAPLENKRADEIIKTMINNGWITAIIPNQAGIGKTQLRDHFTYDTITDAGTYELDTGLETYAISGEAWKSGESSPLDVINEVMTVEQGLFFINRAGKIRFLHRDRIYSSSPSEPADVVIDGLSTNDMDYVSPQSVANAVKVDYWPKSTTVGEIWKTKERITVLPGPAQIFNVKLENPENSKITALSVNSFTATVLPSIKLVFDPSGASLPAGGVSIVPVLKNGEVELTIQSYFGGEVKVEVTLNGVILLSYGGMSIYHNYTPSQVGVGVVQKDVSSKLLTEPARARQLADFILQQHSRRYATFASIRVASRDETWLTRILTTTIGTRLKLSEPNAGNVAHRVMVVGESANWTPGILDMNYTLRPADTVPYLTMDTTLVGFEGVVY